MRQELWLANSGLLGIFFLILSISSLIEHKPPVFRAKKDFSLAGEKKLNRVMGNIEAIFLNDIFGTFVPIEQKPVKPDFVQPIPEPTPPAPISTPEAPVMQFLPPLAITLKGLIISSDELKNVAMIADETNKEGMYHLGEKIKDGIIVKIAQNRIVLLRVNGQQEVVYLRKDDAQLEVGQKKWEHVIKKREDNRIEIDPTKFVKNIESLGLFFDAIPLVGTAFKNGQPIGIRVSPGTQEHIGTLLGLQSHDIITAVNTISVIDQKSRVDAYNSVISKKVGETITVSLLRNNSPVTITYELKFLRAPSKNSLAATTTPEQNAQAADQQNTQPGALDDQKASRLQQREQRLRDFSKRHENAEEKQNAINEIRKRLLDNLRSRMQNTRTR